MALQQIRCGLKLLGFLDVLTNHPKLLEPVFVCTEDYLTAEVVFSILDFDDSKDQYPVIHGYFTAYVGECERQELEDLLIYCTGSKILPFHKIKVKYSKEEGLFSSTCLFHLKIPVGFENNQDFQLCFKALCASSSKAFTSV